MHSKTDYRETSVHLRPVHPVMRSSRISRGAACAPNLWEYLLVSDCCRNCRLRRNDCWRSCDEHLGRIPEEGTYPDGGALCIRSFCNRDGAYKKLHPVSVPDVLLWDCADSSADLYYHSPTGKVGACHAWARFRTFQYNVCQVSPIRYAPVRSSCRSGSASMAYGRFRSHSYCHCGNHRSPTEVPEYMK